MQIISWIILFSSTSADYRARSGDLKYRFAGAASASGHGPHLVHVRSLFRCLDAELARAKRSQTPLAVMQCSTGADVPLSVTHQQTLDFIARLFREHCREYDFTARTGDELVLILPGFRPKDIPDKLALIQQLIDAGGSLSEVPPRLVAGAAFFPDDGTDAEDLLAVAALRLHRNRQPLKTPKTDVESVDRAVNVYATQ